MIYELWHVPTANLVGDFDTKEAALSSVREVLELHGAGPAEEYLLGQEDKAGRSKLIAEGKALVALASGKPGQHRDKATSAPR